jgi:hypothetical protein
MSSEVIGPLESARERQSVGRRSGRELAIEFLGPITILGGIVWGILQPYRIVFFDRSAQLGFYDYLIQPPLLVIVVGLVFTFGIAPGLLEDLRRADGPKG